MSFWRETFPNVEPMPVSHLLDCCPGRLMLRWRGGAALVTACPLALKLDEEGVILGAYRRKVTTVTRHWKGNQTGKTYLSHDYVTTIEQPDDSYIVNGGETECSPLTFTPPDDPPEVPPLDLPDTGVFIEEDEPAEDFEDEVTAGQMMSAAESALTVSEWTDWQQIATLRRSQFLLSLDEDQTWSEVVKAQSVKTAGFSFGGGSASVSFREIELAVMGGRVAGVLTFDTEVIDMRSGETTAYEPGEVSFGYGSGWAHGFVFPFTEHSAITLKNAIWTPIR